MNGKFLLRFVKTVFALILIFVLTAFTVLSTDNVAAEGSLASTFAARTAAQDAQIANLPTNQIIIQYKTPSKAFTQPAQTDLLQRMSQAAGVTLTYTHAMSGDAQILRLPTNLPLDQVRAIADRLATQPDVAYAEPDQKLYHTLDPVVNPSEPTFRPLLLTPNDPLFAQQPDLQGGSGINANAAWNITTGSASLVVAVIDTGITNHAEFVGRTVPGYDFISDPLVANDGNGRDNNPSDPGDWITAADSDGSTHGGWFLDCPVENSSWHGTHTAGTIGAAGNNGRGVAGINWKSKILPVRVLGKCGGYTSDIVDGMRWAAGLPVPGVPANAHPAKVLSLSLGGASACDNAFQTAINQIHNKGAVIVVAAGNSASDVSGFTPANCNNVIAVSATNPTGNLTYYSNYGAKVKISAPGGEQFSPNDPNGILSTLNTGLTRPVADTYVYYQGTSMATPHVSGVVSLLLSIQPSLSPDMVLQILQKSSTPFSSGSTCTTAICGSGIVNAAGALTYLNPTITISGNTGVPGTKLSYLYGGTPQIATADGSGNYSFKVWYNWSGTVTPSAPLDLFTPDHIDYSGVTADQTLQDYTPTPLWTISGNTGIAGTTLSYHDDVDKTVTADGAGNYSLVVPDGWAGTITPSQAGVNFTPTNLDYSSTPVTANITGQDFTNDQTIHSISGSVSEIGATVSFSVDSGPQTVLSDSLGHYTVLVPDGWGGLITPSKTGVTFMPNNLDFGSSPVTADLTGQNFIASQTFLSTAAQDGWVLESSQTSGKGGSLNNKQTTFPLGDDAANRQYRAILSFNTSGLPDAALIQTAGLSIKRTGAIAGANPFNALGNLWIDIRRGTFGSSVLQITDFNATASMMRAGLIGKTPVAGWYSGNLMASGFPQIDPAGTTQFRLYFAKGDNNNRRADYALFLSGNSASGQPTLTITYSLP